jgi:haloalkane dehalogenase
MFANLPYARTPDSRFTDVPDWPYEPSYLVLDAPSGLRVAVYDATNDAAKSSSSPPETFFCLHGEPTWSFLYRKMASVFLSRDVPTRFVAFDFMGFGRSDKPTRSEDYSYERHRETAIAVVRHCSIKNATLVVQDWGSLLGLTLPHEFEKSSMDAKDRAFTRLILMNGWLPTGDTSNAFIGNGFMRWKGVAAAMSPDMPVDFIMRSATGATKKVVEAWVLGYF